jgi:dihydroorotate dehydrogenase electron transfer subunit
MHTGNGIVAEVYLQGVAVARISCGPGLIPEPGQYLLADIPTEQTAPLPVPIFPAGAAEGGFFVASTLPKTWTPGTSLSLRGPLGRGFNLPLSPRKVALVVLGDTPNRLAALIYPALAQGAAITLLCDQIPPGLPSEIEIMPISSLPEVCHWADYVALDMPRELVQTVPDLFRSFEIGGHAQILLTSSMPCGGRGDCGVCAVNVKRGYKLICKDGPVFDLKLFL